MRYRPRARVAPCSGNGPVARSSDSMPFNIQAVLLGRAAFLASFLLSGSSSLQAQTPCPAPGVSALEGGWRAYRGDSLQKAIRQFELAHRLCPENLDAGHSPTGTSMREPACSSFAYRGTCSTVPTHRAAPCCSTAPRAATSGPQWRRTSMLAWLSIKRGMGREL